jgi:hypothetical protein
VTCPGAIIGAANRQRVLDWLLANPGGTNMECSAEIGLSIMAVSRHVRAIRAGRKPAISERAAMPDERELTFGEKAVGLTFNPSGDDAVAQCKAKFAALIDDMHVLRSSCAPGQERGRLASVTITELQTAQMWAVKALTWRD